MLLFHSNCCISRGSYCHFSPPCLTPIALLGCCSHCWCVNLHRNQCDSEGQCVLGKSSYNHCQHVTSNGSIIRSDHIFVLWICPWVTQFKGNRLKGNLSLALWSKSYHSHLLCKLHSNILHFKSHGVHYLLRNEAFLGFSLHPLSWFGVTNSIYR